MISEPEPYEIDAEDTCVKKKKILRIKRPEEITEKEKPTQLTIKQKQFLAAFSQTGNRSYAAKLVGIGPSSHNYWMEVSELYRQAFKEAHDQAADALELEARRRAVDGVKRLKIHNGRPVIDPVTKQPLIEHEYSDTLLIFLMKGAMPDKYKENKAVQHTGGLKHDHQHKHDHEVRQVVLNIDQLNLPIEVRRQILQAMKIQEAKEIELKDEKPTQQKD